MGTPVARRIGVNRDHQRRVMRTGKGEAVRERNENIGAAGHCHAIPAGRLQQPPQLQRSGQGDVLFQRAGSPDRSRVLAAVARVNDDKRPRVRPRRALGRWRRVVVATGSMPRQCPAVVAGTFCRSHPPMLRRGMFVPGPGRRRPRSHPFTGTHRLRPVVTG
jgi:hypothetical protein